MLVEQTPQVARPYAHAIGKLLQIAIIQSTLRNELERMRHDGQGAKPSRTPRRGVRAAALAGAKTCRLGRLGAVEPSHVERVPERCRADRPAVDSGSGYTGEEAAVEAPIATIYRLPTGCRVKFGPPIERTRYQVCRGTMRRQDRGRHTTDGITVS